MHTGTPVQKHETIKPVVAAFDFDGTLSYHDVLISYLFYTHGIVKGIANLVGCAPYLIGFVLGIVPRQVSKEHVITRFYKNRPIQELRQQGEAFAKEVLPSKIKPEALNRLNWHLNHGHRCVLISATLDIFLKPWAEQVGIHDVISSTLEVDAQGKVTGRLEGENCWGEEKIRRLEALIGMHRNEYILYAYGDSRGDEKLLEAADFPYYRKFD